MDPGETNEPTQPTDSAKPTEPTRSKRATESAEPTPPTEPTEPTEPGTTGEFGVAGQPGLRRPRAVSFDAAANEEISPDQESTKPVDTDESVEDSVIVGDRELPRSHRRRGRPGLVVPIVVFVTLILGGAAVGRFVVPAGGPQSGSQPPTGAAPASLDPTTPSIPQTPGGPALPTPPARPADQLADWAARISPVVQVPAVAVQAYGYAQLVLQQTDPACRLGWTTLAGIGEVESKHGQAAGSLLEPNGRSTPPIVGPLLDGRGGRALVADTDAGAFDGDATFDRTMGPLRFLPSQWRAFAIDADADAIVDPFDIDDAALSLARLLCSGNEDMSRRAGWEAAVARHHQGSAHLRTVFNAADRYGEATKDIA